MKIPIFLIPLAQGNRWKKKGKTYTETTLGHGVPDRKIMTDDIFYPEATLEKYREQGIDTSGFQVAQSDSGKGRGLEVSTEWDVLTPEGLLGK